MRDAQHVRAAYQAGPIFWEVFDSFARNTITHFVGLG